MDTRSLCYNLSVNLPHENTQDIIARRLDEMMPAEMREVLSDAARIAFEHGWRIYLEGGYVRDLLLNRRGLDVDLSVVGDGVALATLLAQKRGIGKLETHGAFGTASLDLGSEARLDIVTARKEEYSRPGALPTVEPGTLEDDLARRDFTINAMAVEILPGGAGELVDPHGGVRDMRSGLVRVLHERGFLDDPTRIFRAVRYAERLGFKIELGTLELILQAVRDGALATVSIDRSMHEILLVMEEPRAAAMLAKLDTLGALVATHAGLIWPYTDDHIAPTERQGLTREERRDTYLAILGAEYATDSDEAEAVARSLHLPTPLIALMRDAARLAGLWSRLGEEDKKPSETYWLLRDIDPAAIEAYGRVDALSADSVHWARLQEYLSRLRHTTTLLNGDYLRSMGIPPGPVYREVLAELLSAKLDGQVQGMEDEEKFVRACLARRGLLENGRQQGRH